MNNLNNTWIYENQLLKNKNQRYYYDFGTGNKIEREEVKEKFMHFLADVAPWVLWGNSPDDSTSMLERIVTPLVLQYYEENILPRSGDNPVVSDR